MKREKGGGEQSDIYKNERKQKNGFWLLQFDKGCMNLIA
jgi:hypothetical protein